MKSLQSIILSILILLVCKPGFSNNPFDDLQELNGWKYSSWFGWVQDGMYPWVFHPLHGWQFHGESKQENNWFHDPVSGWYLAGPGYAPDIFNMGRNAWLTYLEADENKRIFLDNALGENIEFGLYPDQFATQKNGFVLENAIIDTNEIISGGPPRDGIPAISNPQFVTQALASNYMSDDDIVISVTHSGVTRAYPFRILNWHEIVIDQFGDLKVAVTYCPLCGTAMVFDRTVNGRELTFGVSGLLYRDNVLMYDHQTESLWNQLALEAQTGIQFKTRLRWIPSRQLRYSKWQEEFPDSKVLSTDTGYSRDYSRDPYTWVPGYDGTLSDVPILRDELPVKEWIFGIILNDRARAYPLVDLLSDAPIREVFEGVSLHIVIDAESTEVTITREDINEPVPVVQSFWFAWQGFYPETTIYGF